MITKQAPSSALAPVLATLGQRGWACHETTVASTESFLREIGEIGDVLGTRAKGRASALEELVEPLTPHDAHPRSLSARYGLDALPLHVELSHRPRPCRYLLLGCVDPGASSTDTSLLDWPTLSFSSEEQRLLESAPVLVRTGRRSFYSTILSIKRAFIRYDPGCLEAVDDRGRAALRLVEDRLAAGASHRYRWRRGDVLIIDNWRVLHGRGPSAVRSGRRIARILIDA